MSCHNKQRRRLVCPFSITPKLQYSMPGILPSPHSRPVGYGRLRKGTVAYGKSFSSHPRPHIPSSPLLRLFGPGVFQRDGPVEHKLAWRAVFIQREVAQPLELVTVLAPGVLQARLT